MTHTRLDEIVNHCAEISRDLSFATVNNWKRKNPGHKAIGYMPIYVPEEIIHAAGMLPVGIYGGGDQVEIIRGDSYFQSYICHIPRSTIELALNKSLDCLDGMLFPSICDVIRNLSGMWKIMFPEQYVRYFDVPQNDDPEVGGHFYERELRKMAADLEALGGHAVTDNALQHSIGLFNRNRQLVNQLYEFRRNTPWKIKTSELYGVLRAGAVMAVEDYNTILEDLLNELNKGNDRSFVDNIRVVVVGSFCEQPPLNLIKSIERAGCYIVDDDFILGNRWIQKPIATDGDPFASLVRAFLEDSVSNTAHYEPQKAKGEFLIEQVRQSKADGVLFCAASFCDPALLDQPMLVNALERASIPYTALKFSENSGQFHVIREQVGTFSDSIKLWGNAA